MKVIKLLEDPFDKPWTNNLARQAALKFQQELLDIDDGLDIDLTSLNPGLLSDAIVNNGMPATFAPFMIKLTGGIRRDLLVYYAPRPKKFMLYDVDTDFFTADMKLMYEHLKLLDTNVKEGLVHDRVVSSSNALTSFAKELSSHGFEAEVKSSSKPGIINSSKLCIEVKGYGMKDSLKLYKPLWRHEKGMIAFVDVKTEKRFSTVAEMVNALKETYPKLPQCLSYFPPLAKKKLKESPEEVSSIKKRILKLQADLIDQLPDTFELGDLKHVKAKIYAAKFDRFIIPLKHISGNFIIVVDSHDQIEVNGVQRAPDETPLVSASLYKAAPEISYQKLISLNYKASTFSDFSFKRLYYDDESNTGRQEVLDDLVQFLIQEPLTK